MIKPSKAHKRAEEGSMKCPSCDRRHSIQKIITIIVEKKTKHFAIRVCTTCRCEFGMDEVSRSSVTNSYFLKGKEKED